MSENLKLILSLSISASIIALIIFTLKPFIKDKISKSWQYYIWLIVVVRLITPFSIETNIVNKVFTSTYKSSTTVSPKLYNGIYNIAYESQDFEIENSPIVSQSSLNPKILNFKFIVSNLLYISLIISFLILTKHVTSYRSFIKYIKAGRRNIKDEEILDIFFETANELNLKIYPNLYSHKLIYSSMAIGIIKPFVVIPEIQLQNKENLKYIFLHELTHIKRYDTIYKWIVQILVCIHWFNPILYFVKKDINDLCELSCDEQVIKKFDENERVDYGNTLLHSIEISGDYTGEVVYNQLCENGKLIKERLKSIKYFGKKSRLALSISTILTCTLFISAIVTGAYTKKESIATVSAVETTEINKLKEQNIENKSAKSYENIDKAVEDELHSITSLLPFMSTDKVDQLAIDYFNKTKNTSDIVKFLPFMSRDTVDYLANNIITVTDSINGISAFLPFMSRDAVDDLASEIISKTDNTGDIKSLLPFMHKDKVDQIATDYFSKTKNISSITSFLPFMNRDTVGKLADKMLQETNDIDDIKSLLPFLSKDYIDTIADLVLDNESDDYESNSKNRYDIYKPYGLELKEDKLIYNGKEVRWFIDINRDEPTIYSSGNIQNSIDVEAIRKDGKLIGLKQCTQEEYNNHNDYTANDFIEANKKVSKNTLTYNLQNMNKLNDIGGENMFANYSANNDFSFDEENKLWRYDGKVLKLFYDDISSDIIVLYYNSNDIALKEGIGIKYSGVINNGKKEFVKLTEEELNSIYTDKMFKGLNAFELMMNYKE